MGPQNEPGVHVYARIAEDVGAGWPAYMVTAEQAQHVVELRKEGRNELQIAYRAGLGLKATEAIIAEATGYGVLD